MAPASPQAPLLSVAMAVALAVATAAVASPTAGDAARGRQAFVGQCALCHGATGGGGQGPALSGVVGRKAASTRFAYSQALRRTGWTWGGAHLDAYLKDSQAAVPGTTMAVAIADGGTRRDLIAYLAGLKLTAAPAAPTPGPAPAAARASPFGDYRSDAPGRLHHIVPADLPAPFVTPSAENGSHVSPRPPGALPRAPEGFRVTLYAAGLSNPRQMKTAPDGDVFVAETAAGRIRVLRGPDGADKAQASAVFAQGLTGPFGLAFYPAKAPKWLYVAERNRVVRFPYAAGALKAGGPAQVVVAQLAPSTGGHTTRDLVFSPDGTRMFVSVGSASNVAEEMPGKPVAQAQAFERAHGLGTAWGPEENRAVVLAFTPEGADGRVLASGIRNCVGLAVQPATGALWCSTNERDDLGDDLVPDYVTRVRAGGYYGWPWWYIGDHEDPRLKGQRPDLKGKATVPDVLIQPHSASLGMTFDAGAHLPPAWKGSAFAAEHGSWNRAVRTGPKLIRIPMNPDGSPTGAYEDVLTGFTIDNADVWGRPVSVTVAHDGALLVSDDGGGVVWRLAWMGR